MDEDRHPNPDTDVPDDVPDAHAADRELVAELLRQGPNSQLWQHTAREIYFYGTAVLDSMLKSGLIFDRVAAIGRGLQASEARKRHLRQSSHARDDLVHDTCSAAIQRFLRDGVLGGGWKSEEGASLKTYFVGTLVQEFPNTYRYWARTSVIEIIPDDDSDSRLSLDPTDSYLSARFADGLIEQHVRSPENRAIIRMWADRYTYAEISDVTGRSHGSIRAIIDRFKSACRASRLTEEGNEA